MNPLSRELECLDGIDEYYNLPVAGDKNSKEGKDEVQIDGSPKSPEELAAI